MGNYTWKWHIVKEKLPNLELVSYCGIHTGDADYLDWKCHDYVIEASELPSKLAFEGTHDVCDVCVFLDLGNTNERQT
jgi:hypothetical protein